MICWHRYDKWSKLVNTFDGVWQYRTCQKCGKIEKHKSGCSNNFNLLMWNKQDVEENNNS